MRDVSGGAEEGPHREGEGEGLGGNGWEEMVEGERGREQGVGKQGAGKM